MMITLHYTKPAVPWQGGTPYLLHREKYNIMVYIIILNVPLEMNNNGVEKP